jgi:hypothetical protein
LASASSWTLASASALTAPDSRSTTTQAYSTVAPAARRTSTASRTLLPEVVTSSTTKTLSPRVALPSMRLPVPCLRSPLADDQERQVGLEAHGGGERDSAELHAGHGVEGPVAGGQLRHLVGDELERRGVGAGGLHVDVVGRLDAGRQGEVAELHRSAGQQGIRDGSHPICCQGGGVEKGEEGVRQASPRQASLGRLGLVGRGLVREVAAVAVARGHEVGADRRLAGAVKRLDDEASNEIDQHPDDWALANLIQAFLSMHCQGARLNAVSGGVRHEGQRRKQDHSCSRESRDSHCWYHQALWPKRLV